MNKIRLDLFSLHKEEDSSFGRIKVERNDCFLSNFLQLIEEIKNFSSFTEKEISEKLDIHPDLLSHYKRDRKIPLGFLINLIELWKDKKSPSEEEYKEKILELQDSISKVSHATGRFLRKTKCPNFLSLDLCELTGAMIADGNLYLGENEMGHGYLVRITDYYKDNLTRFCSLLNNEFGIKQKPKFVENNNYWEVKFANKVIFRYLNKILKIPIGDKTSIVKTPPIIKKAPLKYKKSFAGGVMMFDGGFGLRGHYYNVSSKSETLISEIGNIWTKSGIKEINNQYDPRKEVYQIRARNESDLRKILNEFIESNTTKWKKVNFFLNGFEDYSSLEDAVNTLNKVYPKIGDCTSLTDVISVVKKLKVAKTKEIHKHLNVKHARSIFEYLKILEEWDILNSSKDGNCKLWYVNPELNNGLKVWEDS